MNNNGNDKIDVTGYILLFSGKDWDLRLSVEELRQAMDRTNAWFDKLLKRGKVKGGQALGSEGQNISGKRGGVVIDGPFVESKETIGGYVVLNVTDLDEALAIARSAPGLDYGVSIQVRPIMDECPVAKRARARLDLAPA